MKCLHSKFCRTPLLITDAKEDKVRLEEAEKKAREIETSEKVCNVKKTNILMFTVLFYFVY